MNSSIANYRYALATVSAVQTGRFWEKLANLPNELQALPRFQNSFGGFLEGFATEWGESPVVDSEGGRIRHAQIIFLREDLRHRWLAQTTRDRDVFASQLRTRVLNSVQAFLCRKSMGLSEGYVAVPGGLLIPPLHPFEQALKFLDVLGPRTRYCANPRCPEPYFVADRRTAKYCCEECAKPAQAAFKREWWNQHGRQWRKQRAARNKNRTRPLRPRAGQCES